MADPVIIDAKGKSPGRVATGGQSPLKPRGDCPSLA